MYQPLTKDILAEWYVAGENRIVRRKATPDATLFTSNPTRTPQGLNPDTDPNETNHVK